MELNNLYLEYQRSVKGYHALSETERKSVIGEFIFSEGLRLKSEIKKMEMKTGLWHNKFEQI